MKMKLVKISILVLICAVLLLSAATLAKYVVELSIDDSVTAEHFYFRSNVLVENQDLTQLTPITVNGKTTTATLSNGAGLLTFSDNDIAWELQYYVDAGAGFVPVLQNPEQHTLVSGSTMSTETLTLSPVTYEGNEYRDVIVEARSVAPYVRVLRVRLQFEYTEHTVSYSYLQSTGVITATVTTNDEPGQCRLTWLYPLIPDNADPNGILTDAKSPAPDDTDGESVDAYLDDHTTYHFYFFIDPAMRELVDQTIDGATDAEIEALILQYLIISYE